MQCSNHGKFKSAALRTDLDGAVASNVGIILPLVLSNLGLCGPSIFIEHQVENCNEVSASISALVAHDGHMHGSQQGSASSLMDAYLFRASTSTMRHVSVARCYK
jgi:hypothetical protein